MAGHSSKEVEEILTALSPLVSTRQRRPVAVRRAATPSRKVAVDSYRVKGEDTAQSQSSSPLKLTMQRKPGSEQLSDHELEAHPFTNMKIRMLINLHNSMQEGESLPQKDTVKLPRLTDLRSSVPPSSKS